MPRTPRFRAAIGIRHAIYRIADSRQKRWGKRFRSVLAEIACQELGGPPHRVPDFFLPRIILKPAIYDLRFSQELQNGTTTVDDWAMTAEKVLQNLNIAPANFEVK
jgi:hypothetical protein